MPLYERSVGFASVQSLCAFISGFLAFLALPVASTLSISTTFSKAHQPPRPAPPHLPPLLKVRCCRLKKFGRLPEGLSLHQPFQNSTIPLAFRRARACVCLVGFASIAIVVVCGRCVLHRLFATTCKHPCLKPLGVQLRASMPALEKGEVARLIKFYGLLYSIQIVLLLRF